MSSEGRMSGLVGVIPVRRRSTGLPNKNMKLLAGKPLLGYTIEAAKDSQRLSRVIVSADDPEIVLYASKEGAEAVLHPLELSEEGAPTIGVVLWNYAQLVADSCQLNAIVVLRATTPLRTGVDIDNAINLLLRNSGADSVVSVVVAPGIHPVRMKRILADGRLVDAFEPEGHSPRQRQTLEPLYLRNGGIYIARSCVLDRGYLWGDHCLAYVMPPERSVNINNAFDFTVADLLVRASLR